MKTKLAVRVSSDLKEFVKTNSLEPIISCAFKNQFSDIVFYYPNEQDSLLAVRDHFTRKRDVFILNLDAHAKTLDSEEGFDLHISRLYDYNAQFKGFINREGSKPIHEQIQEAKETFQKSGKCRLVIYDEDSVTGFLNDLISKEFKADFPDLGYIHSTSQKEFPSDHEILDLKDFIINCQTISSGLYVQKHSLSSFPAPQRIPYTYNKKLLQALGSVDPKNYPSVLHLTLTLSLLYAEENSLPIDDVLETYREITSKQYDDYFN